VTDCREALSHDGKFPPAHITLARLLASCPEAKTRDGMRAVLHAKAACELTGWKSPHALDALAAAYAETGQFKEAVKWQKKALEAGFGDKGQRERARKRLKLYEAGKPYRAEP
jgi:hypothetical protein